jgi:hypothetical protein
MMLVSFKAVEVVVVDDDDEVDAAAAAVATPLEGLAEDFFDVEEVVVLGATDIDAM